MVSQCAFLRSTAESQPSHPCPTTASGTYACMYTKYVLEFVYPVVSAMSATVLGGFLLRSLLSRDMVIP